MKILRQTAVLLALLAVSIPVAGQGSDAALGDDGALYLAVAGSYSELFPGGTDAAPGSAVLALDVLAPGESRVRRLVPGSEGAATDLSPVVVFEPSSGTAYVLWESRRASGSSAILLAGLRGDDWIGAVELSGDAAPLKRAPSVLITRSEFPRPTVTEGQVLQGRTVLHVVWWEQTGNGDAAVQYTPVVMENGTYIGWNPVFRLDRLDPNEALPGPVTGSELHRSPALSPGLDVHTAIIAFTNPRTGRLLTVQARVLPGELGLLADRIPDAVVAAGYSDGPDRLENIRGILRSHVIEIGSRFNPGVIGHFADAVVAAAEVVHEADPDLPLRALGDDLRSHVIEIGAHMLGDVGRPALAKASRVLEVRAGDAEQSPEAVSNLVHLRVVRDMPAPEVGSGTVRVYVSEDGERLLVSWRDEDGVTYRESLSEAAAQSAESGAWTGPLALELGGETVSPDVESILRARVLQRP